MVLGAASQKHASGAAIAGLLAADKTEALAIEGFGALDIVDEQADRTDLGDLERARQQHPFHIVGRGQSLFGLVARQHFDALAICLSQLRGLGHLRQWRLFVKAAIIHLARLAQPVPADLLDPIVKLVGMPVGVVDIDMPVAARHVAADALDPDLLFLEIAMGVGDLLEAAALPGDLVDRDLGRKFAVGAMVHHPLREQHKGVMVGAVAHEIAARVAEIGILREPGRPRKIERVGSSKAEQVAIERAALRQFFDIEAEMAEPADLERPRQKDPADIVALGKCRHRWFLLGARCEPTGRTCAAASRPARGDPPRLRRI